MDSDKERSLRAVETAYSNRDNHALLQAFRALQEELLRNVQSLGRVAAMLRLSDSRTMAAILNKVAAETGETIEGQLAFAAGFLSGFCNDLLLNKDREDLLAANAQLLSDPKGGPESKAVRPAILKMAFAQEGARFTELIETVARVTEAKHSSVKHHVKALTNLKLLDRFQLGKKTVFYRTSRLGESVLAWVSHPHELAEFLIDLAAQNGEMRKAMQTEIDRIWLRRKPEVPRLRGSSPQAQPSEFTSSSQGSPLAIDQILNTLMNNNQHSRYKM